MTTIAERRAYQQSERHFLADMGVELPDDETPCRECGCTDTLGCEEGCWWVETDLCSSCAEELGDAP